MIDLAELRRAVSGNQMVPYFQPIMELRSGRLAGVEVLARWAHPVFGAYLPLNLIELAEQNGLIADVADQVLTKAFRGFRETAETLRLSINVSPVQLGYRDFVDRLIALTCDCGFPMTRLTLEITETALLTDLTRALDVADALKGLGCHLSLDDFGTGFSSLAHLQALPFNELKIDRSFIQRMTERRASRKIVAAMIGLGRSLGLRTVAEGIETEQQAEMVLRLGAELAQGWHYGRPMPLEAIRGLMAEPARPIAGLAPQRQEKREIVSSLEAFPAQRLAQLQAIYDGAPVGLCFLDCGLRYVSLNQKLAEINGASVAAHLGNTVQQMVPDLYPKVEPFLLRALGGEAIAGVEVERSAPGSQEPVWNLISYQPAFDEANEVIGISISVMDISELKQARDELKEKEFLQRQLVELNREVVRPGPGVVHDLDCEPTQRV